MREDALLGRELAGFRVEALIGRGGMGRVYRATQQSLGRVVALKILAPELAENDEFRRRFLYEARLAGSLEHAHVLPVYDAGKAEGYLFLAMRLVEGASPDLGSLIAREGPLRPERAVQLLEHAASALDAAHAKGLVHRDVKPGNLLLAGDHLYLTDFGVAKPVAARRELTRTGVFIGTLDYASPEQIQNEPLDGGTDIYALGAVFYQCLTGQVPFERPSEYLVMQAHLTELVPRPSEMRTDLPAGLDEVVAMAMAKERDERYRSGKRMAEAARAALEVRYLRATPPTMIAPVPAPLPIQMDAEQEQGRTRLRFDIARVAGSVLVLAALGLSAWAFITNQTQSSLPSQTPLASTRPVALTAAPSPAVEPTATTTPVSAPIWDLIERANLAEIIALEQVDAAPFECCYAGEQLEGRRRLISGMRATERKMISTLEDLQFVGEPVPVGDEGWFLQRTVEVWSSVEYRQGAETTRSTPRPIPQNYTLALVDDRWLIVDHEFEPVIRALGCPSSVGVSQVATCVPSVDGDGDGMTYRWSAPSGSPSTTELPGFATALGVVGVADVSLRVCDPSLYCDERTDTIQVSTSVVPRVPLKPTSATAFEVERTECSSDICPEGPEGLSVTWTLPSSVADVLGSRIYMGVPLEAGATCVPNTLVFQLMHRTGFGGPSGSITVRLHERGEGPPRGGSVQQLYRQFPAWWKDAYCVAVALFGAEAESPRVAATVRPRAH